MQERHKVRPAESSAGCRVVQQSMGRHLLITASRSQAPSRTNQAPHKAIHIKKVAAQSRRSCVHRESRCSKEEHYRTRPVEHRVVHKHPVHVVAVQVEEPCRLWPAVAQRHLRAHARIHRILVQSVVRAAVQVPGACAQG